MLGGLNRWVGVFVWMRMGIMGVLLLLSSVIDVSALAGEVEAGWLLFGALIGFDGVTCTVDSYNVKVRKEDAVNRFVCSGCAICMPACLR